MYLFWALLALLLAVYPSRESLLARHNEPASKQTALEEFRRLDPSGCVTFVVFSPDGRTLAYGLSPFGVDGEGSKVVASTVVMNVADGKEKFRIPAEKWKWPNEARYSADGKMRQIGTTNDSITLWDPKTEKRGFTLDGSAGGNGKFAFSPDRKLLATTVTRSGKRGLVTDITLWDVASGKAIRTFGSEPHGRVMRFSFSDDGKTLAVEHRAFASGTGWGRGAKLRIRTTAHLWESDTGKEIGQIGSDTEWEGSYHLTPAPGMKLWETGAVGEDGAVDVRSRSCAAAYPQAGYRLRRSSTEAIVLMPIQPKTPFWFSERSDGMIFLYRSISGTEVVRSSTFVGGTLNSVAMSADGRYLAACGQLPRRASSTLFIWDLKALPKPDLAKELEVGPSTLDSWWAELSSANTLTAHKAMRRLVALPDKALPLLAERLHLSPTRERISALIEQLDDEKTRETATQQLAQAVIGVRPALKKLIRGATNQEKKLRLEKHLETFSKEFAREELRSMRAIDVLEQIASPKAKEFLTKLGKGNDMAPLARAAEAALVRLKKEPAAEP